MLTHPDIDTPVWVCRGCGCAGPAGTTGTPAVKPHLTKRDQARLEDIQWMVETGETSAGISARLGITIGALTRWLDRHCLKGLVSL